MIDYSYKVNKLDLMTNIIVRNRVDKQSQSRFNLTPGSDPVLLNRISDFWSIDLVIFLSPFKHSLIGLSIMTSYS